MLDIDAAYCYRQSIMVCLGHTGMTFKTAELIKVPPPTVRVSIPLAYLKKTTNFTKFFVYELPVDVAWSSSDNNTVQYVMYFRFRG